MSGWDDPTTDKGGWDAPQPVNDAQSGWGRGIEDSKGLDRADSPHPDTANLMEEVNLEVDLPVSREENVEKLQAKGWVAQISDNAAVTNSGKFASEWQFEGLRDLTIEDESQLINLDKDSADTKGQASLGMVGPRVPAIEKKLYDTALFGVKGNRLEAFSIESKYVGENAPQTDEEKETWKAAEFADAGLHPVLLENLRLAGYDVPTPVQQRSLKAILTGRDILLTAATGSGKTAAYLIPVINKFFGKVNLYCKPRPELGMEESFVAEPVLLIIVPTRELAAQIFYEVARLCYRSLLRPCAVYGGGPVKGQIEELKKGCDILIGTFGRLLDFLGKGRLSLKRVKVQVIDEADEVMKEDHREDLEKVFLSNPNMTDDDNQLIIASATWSETVFEFANDLLAEDNWQIQLGRPGMTHANIEQRFLEVEPATKKAKLYELLDAIEKPERTIVFVNAKAVAQQVDDFLYRLGFPSTLLSGDMTQREREDAVRAFTIGTAPIMVCSSLAARGIDIPDVQHVINFDLPSVLHGGIDEYVNRIGRTGRIGHSGLATSFYTRRDEELVMPLVNLFIETKQDVPELLRNFMVEPANSETNGSTHTETPNDNANDTDEGVALSSSGGDEANGNEADGGSDDSDSSDDSDDSDEPDFQDAEGQPSAHSPSHH